MNLDLEKELNEVYPKRVTSLRSERKGELMKLYKEPKSTGTGKKIKIYHIAFVALICMLAVGVSAIGATASGFDVAKLIYEKTENTTLSDQEKMEIAERLESHFQRELTEEDIEGMDPEDLPDLQTNEYGLSYGVYQLAPDLFGVENGELTAYCYYSDMEGISGMQDPITYVEKMKKGLWRNWIYAYDVDGKTVVGKFILGASAYYNMAYCGGDKYGLVSNEDLENEGVRAGLVDGENIEEYEAMAAERSEALGN